MNLFVFFLIIFLIFYTVLTNPDNDDSIDKVKRDSNNDCLNISILLEQARVDVNDCCKNKHIGCNEDGRITYM